MYLIKSITFNFARRLKLISGIIIGTVKDIIKVVLYPLSLPLKLLLNRPKRRRFKHYKPSHKRTYADEFMKRRYDDDFIVVDDNPGDKPGLNHKHDNYQSQIDMLARKINELFLTDEAYNKQFNRFESSVEERITKFFKLNTTMVDKLKSIETKVEILEDKVKGCYNVTIDNQECIATIGDKIKSLKAKVDKILSENSELTFKPLTKEEEQSLEIANGECEWDDEVRDYPSEPDFQAEQKAMAKQMAKVVERDEA